MRLHSCFILLVAVAALRAVSAGCAGEILDCKPRNLCATKQCGQGLVCRVDNCNGCTAMCEPPGTVHIMSLPSSSSASKPAKPGTGSTSTVNTGNSQVSQESGPSPSGPSCPCPKSYIPVCSTDGKVYANDCLAKCAGATIATYRPDKNGKCPLRAAAAAPSPKRLVDQQQKPLAAGFTCRCAMSYSPVCGVNGKFFENECLAICSGTKVAKSIKPDMLTKTCATSGSNRRRSLAAAVAQ